jgi:hypothetical protein
MRATLIVIRHLEIDGRTFTHGAELPPNLLTDEQVDKLLDQGRLAECPERRSLYRLFPAFSGAKDQEFLTDAELTAYALRE